MEKEHVVSLTILHLCLVVQLDVVRGEEDNVDEYQVSFHGQTFTQSQSLFKPKVCTAVLGILDKIFIFSQRGLAINSKYSPISQSFETLENICLVVVSW